jgi:ketosteroid isomerase-like protein
MITDARRVLHAVVVAYNNKKWDELRALYAEDAVMLPPNHDPIRGRDAITEYLRSIRDVAGPLDDGSFDAVRARANGKIADLVDKFTMGSGRVRLLADGLFERQPDGSVLVGVDQFGFADAAG